jgi:RHS repeat-associated protein
MPRPDQRPAAPPEGIRPRVEGDKRTAGRRASNAPGSGLLPRMGEGRGPQPPGGGAAFKWRIPAPISAFSRANFSARVTVVIADERTLLVTTGQWMQEDPIQFSAGDPNVRRYVGNSPTNSVDPSGLRAADAPIVAKAKEALKLFVDALNAAGQRPATAVVAYDVKTGNMVTVTSGTVPTNIHPELAKLANEAGGLGVKTASGNTVGCCAEFRGANELLQSGSRLEDIRFTDAIRPRNGQVIPACENCQAMFGKNISATAAEASAAKTAAEAPKPPAPAAEAPKPPAPAPEVPKPPAPAAAAEAPKPPARGRPPSPKLGGIGRGVGMAAGAAGLALDIWILAKEDAERVEGHRKNLGLPEGSELIKEKPTLGGLEQTWRTPDRRIIKREVRGYR